MKKPTHKIVYLMPTQNDGVIWCQDPAPEQGMKAEHSQAYIRKDLADLTITNQQHQIDALNVQIASMQDS